MDIETLLNPWSPWRIGDRLKWANTLPAFTRPVFADLIRDIESLSQIVSITGPHRVGKSTIQRQIIRFLMEERGVEPSAIAYFSFDDPALFRGDSDGGEVFESLMRELLRHAEAGNGTAYLLLDEIQTLDRWEQYLKKYYDLEYPFKFIISGSASSPIFKKSRESLLGRVKDYHLLPFSFGEFVQYLNSKNSAGLEEEITSMVKAGREVRGMFAHRPTHIDLKKVPIPDMSDELWNFCNSALDTYFVDGGFPEVWNIESEDQKIDYLFDNQVKKVIMEDLVLATELRKPEQLKRFYISLLEQPGREVNKSKLSQELGIGVRQIDKYMPLLEMTDLVRSADKFRKSALKVRSGSQKFYPTDMALRNAVLRLGADALLGDEAAIGLYAETFVFNSLKKWEGVLAVDYYRTSAQREVDFIVHLTPSRYLPVEVKYKNQWRSRELKGLKEFLGKHDCASSILVTKKREDFGPLSNIRTGPGSDIQCFCLPLVQFLIMMS